MSFFDFMRCGGGYKGCCWSWVRIVAFVMEKIMLDLCEIDNEDEKEKSDGE